jgi:hypothetical protein
MKSSELDKTMFFRNLLSCVVVTVVLFLGAYLWDTQISRPATTSKNISATIPEKSKYKHTRIADIKVGERVVTSSDDTPKSTAVDPATWKKVTLYAEETWYDGTVDSINVVTLVPPEWLAICDAKVGSMVPIPLDLQEMGLDENLFAKIQTIEECPEIRAGPGRVVLTTVNHLSRGVCSLTYTTQDGQSETIRPTSSHRFYSLDRKEWIHIGDASIGEKLQGLGSGIIEVVSCQLLGTTERVYNMTVEDEHVYHVGVQNLLTHNTGCIPEKIWTDGRPQSSVRNALDHWNKHHKDFPELNNAKEYVLHSYSFIETAPLKKVRPHNGDVMYYDPASNTFAVTDKDGVMKTCFKPLDGINYYNSQ